ncbi:unnamed protein product [Arabis nemorensis]|uniref:Uncharacterized protein n=1 Tax=Arabis nemorensis TaxID=586526 RepID=A0A565C2V7_9BRAS|nr:unnamed protein product [Arabis nemorensis]
MCRIRSGFCWGGDGLGSGRDPAGGFVFSGAGLCWEGFGWSGLVGLATPLAWLPLGVYATGADCFSSWFRWRQGACGWIEI